MMYNQQLSDLIKTAVLQIHSDMNEAAPFMAEQVICWMKTLSGTEQPADYFMHPLGFPMLLLPWWCEQSCRPSDPTLRFQSALAYSTINGYYYIRLIDNLMDGDAEAKLNLLPALNFFHTQFQATYHSYFPAEHPFWNTFKTIWFRSAESAMQDITLVDIDQAAFKQIAGQKVCAGKIPVIATCYYHERPDLIETWSEFIDLLGCWHQMFNDLFDWNKDLTHQNPTYFLSEARRQAGTNDAVTGWVFKGGFVWGCQLMHGWMAELRVMAQTLEITDMVTYLDTRETMFSKRETEVIAGFQDLSKLLAVLRNRN
jgi:hypothetical protein